ncbi:MAG: YSC84-related protein [Gammaproteobacteria bacterium]|nr:YSC84-related protein [Gammaproteobacteria bacterium]
MRSKLIGLFGLYLVLVLNGCATSGAYTKADKRQAILDMRQEVLSELYRTKPGTRTQVAGAPGYAVFSNANVNLILASFSGGNGIVKDSRTGKNTYMKMGEAGIGFGLGVKDFRAVFVFHNRATLQQFIDSGWEFGAHADAAAKANEKGGAIGGEILLDGVTVYQITENGLALQATIKGTKYWKDTELN